MLKLFAWIAFLVWVTTLVTVLHIDGVIQIGGPSFRLRVPHEDTRPPPNVEVHPWNQLEQKRADK